MEKRNKLDLFFQKVIWDYLAIVRLFSAFIQEKKDGSTVFLLDHEKYSEMAASMDHEVQKALLPTKKLSKIDQQGDLNKLKKKVLEELVGRDRFLFSEALTFQKDSNSHPETFSEAISSLVNMGVLTLTNKRYIREIDEMNHLLPQFSGPGGPLLGVLEFLQTRKLFSGDGLLFYSLDERRVKYLSHKESRSEGSKKPAPDFNKNQAVLASIEEVFHKNTSIISPVKIIFTREGLKTYINNKLVEDNWVKSIGSSLSSKPFSEKELLEASQNTVQSYFALIKTGEAAAVRPLDSSLIPLVMDKKYLASITSCIRKDRLLDQLFLIEKLGVGAIVPRYSVVQSDENHYQIMLHYYCVKPSLEEIPLIDVPLARFGKEIVHSYQKIMPSRNSYQFKLNLNEFLIEAVMGSKKFFPTVGTRNLNVQGVVFVVGGSFVGLLKIQKKLSGLDSPVSYKYVSILNRGVEDWVESADKQIPKPAVDDLFYTVDQCLEPITDRSINARNECFSIIQEINVQQDALYQSIKRNGQYQLSFRQYQKDYATLASILAMVTPFTSEYIHETLASLNILNPSTLEHPNKRNLLDLLIAKEQLRSEIELKNLSEELRKEEARKQEKVRTIDRDVNTTNLLGLLDSIKAFKSTSIPKTLGVGGGGLIKELRELGGMLLSWHLSSATGASSSIS